MRLYYSVPGLRFPLRFLTNPGLRFHMWTPLFRVHEQWFGTSKISPIPYAETQNTSYGISPMNSRLQVKFGAHRPSSMGDSPPMC
jgi:hypothetical protein